MDKLSSDHQNQVAIIGMAGRFPGATTIDQLWKNLRNGVESISFFSDEELETSHMTPGISSGEHYVKAGALLDDIECFDASFFGYSPKESEMMDPQQRLFLECAWEALEHASYNTEADHYHIAVYAGVSANTYLLNHLVHAPFIDKSTGTFSTLLGNEKDYLSTRVSYKLNLKGPGVTVQTACSTSLVALHLACQCLLNGESDLALAGGISVKVPQKSGYLYEEKGILSPDGHCRVFAAESKGTVDGNGAGIVVLKRYEDALADGDCIHALIIGSAVNNDGSLKMGYTAPSADGQAEVIVEAHAVAGIDPETITYIEAHGTGTEIGDPIEIAALTQAFRAHTRKKGFCAIGSVKSNFGHLDTAAGAAGLIKTVLALKHKMIPPSLHFHQPNPRIDFENSPFYVNTQLKEWHVNNIPRRAGVSSFGVGGTNAHVILEETPVIDPSSLVTGETRREREYQLILLSAKTQSALDKMSENLVEYFQHNLLNHGNPENPINPGLTLADAAYTLQVGRRSFNHRRMLVCRDINEAAAALQGTISQQVLTSNRDSHDQPVLFTFPGQGAQYVNMGKDLYQTEPVFAEEMDRCFEILRPLMNDDIKEILYPSSRTNGSHMSDNLKINRTEIAQPVLFAFEYALARLWMSWGIRPQAMMGHSIGEYAAACLAGVFSLEDALMLVAARGRLLGQLPEGGMLAVSLSEEELKIQPGSHLSLAAVNAPKRCVVSGPVSAVRALQNHLKEQGIPCIRLNTSHAFHSEMVDPVLAPFKEAAKTVRMQPPQIPILSGVTGTWLTPAQAVDPDYWTRQLRQPVCFAQGINELMQEADGILLEVGPDKTLTSLTQRHPGKIGRVVLSSLGHAEEGQPAAAYLMNTLGRLWLSGAAVDWSGFYSRERRHRIPLPTYPFERQRYWIERSTPSAVEERGQRSTVRKHDIADWFYLPSWKRTMPPAAPAPGALISPECSWLVFSCDNSFGSHLVQRLEHQDRDICVVKMGKQFDRASDGVYSVNPQRSQDYDTLLKELRVSGRLPGKILHLWSVTAADAAGPAVDTVELSQYSSFYSLLFLAQALDRQGITAPVEINVISNNMQRVAGEEVLHPEEAVVLGPCRVIPQEYPNISCRSIDIILPAADPGREEKLANQLINELNSVSPDTLVAYRGCDRWVRTYEACRLEGAAAGTPPRLRPGGVYLITGGLGGIGLQLASYLAKTLRAKLILVGRTVLPGKSQWEPWLATHDSNDHVSLKIRQLQAVEALGAEVLAVPADVTNQEQMQEVINLACRQFGQIHGVIHCAGIAGEGMIYGKTPEVAAQVLAPKVKGTLVLDELVRALKLDFFVLCSSLVSLYGGFGQVDYCAANAFLDAFAHHVSSRGEPFTVSINWGVWTEVGMAVNKTGAPFLGNKTMDHPLLDICLLDTLDERIYLSEFSVIKHWFLNEHKMMGDAVTPAAVYLEMIRAAFAESNPRGIIEIQEVYFTAPLIVKENEIREVFTIIKRNEDIYDFYITSTAGSGHNKTSQWQEHVFGKINHIDFEPEKKVLLTEIIRNCNHKEIDISDGTGEFAKKESPILFGPRWNNIKRAYFGFNQGIARLELPEAFYPDLQTFKLHPALLDMATSFPLHYAVQDIYLPFSYKGIKIKAPLPGKIYSHLKYKESLTSSKEMIVFQCNLVDEQGAELVQIEEFTMKKISRLSAIKTSPAKDRHPLNLLDNKNLFHSLPNLLFLAGQEREKGISPGEGIKAFDRILSRGMLPQTIVFPGDLNDLLETSSQLMQPQVIEEAAHSPQPKQKYPRPLLSNAYQPPCSELEQQMADIWQEMLGIQQVGIHDNFFELGGDSILSIQIIGKARQAGLEFTPKQLFDFQTIAGLMKVIRKTSPRKPGYGMVTGPLPLSPGQLWFFNQGHPEPNFFNRTMLLELEQTLSFSLLQGVIRQLLIHHDALRLRFTGSGSHWQQYIAPLEDTVPLIWIDLSELPHAGQEQAIERTAVELQANLNLTAGPLLRFALFERGDQKPNRLLVILHHLIADDPSWQILLEDFQTLYQQVARGEAMALLPKTASFMQWIQQLTGNARWKRLPRESRFWLEKLRSHWHLLPTDHPGEANTINSTRRVILWLNSQKTRALLQEVPEAYQTRVSEVLLTALVKSLHQWTGAHTLPVEIEDHAREGLFEDLDVSRTVGWFTTIFPMLLHPVETPNPGDWLKSIKEQLRQVPHRGSGYGLLRYLSKDPKMMEKFSTLPQPEIHFSYTGTVDSIFPRESLLKLIAEFNRLTHSLKGNHCCLLEVNGSVIQGRLRLTWTYSKNLHRHETIEGLARGFMEVLLTLIDHCLSPGTGGYTPSDFPEAQLNQKELDELAADFDDDDVEEENLQ
ncbi:MAG: SDR family NAD(P)-dependent oxidoreductase [Candidatus Aminicenantes bacterium]|jgi:non-ribosomal peptide synthase protein (TIGR01720 family)